MRLLVLGGTKFIGPPLVEYALARGHEVTTFTRGETSRGLWDGRAEMLYGDRDGGLDALRGRSWDAVVDNSGYLPRVVRQSVESVDAPYYLFVSTRSVYADLSDAPGEDAPVHGDVDSEDIPEHYGELKAMCERVVQERPGAIVRPGLIVGPGDPTGRFTYWPERIARGGDVLAPGEPSDPVTLIDARDLAEWLVRLCEERTPGVYNAIATTTWGELLDACVRGTGSDAELVWVPTDWLVEHDVGEWMELPLWVASPEYGGMHRVSNDRAVAAGLTFRPFEETARDTLGAPLVEGAGLDSNKERELLESWRASS